MCGSDIFLGILAILFPPLPGKRLATRIRTLHTPKDTNAIAVWVKRGICSGDSLINLALCCLGVLPGLLHAWYIIASYPDPTYEQAQQQDPEGSRVTYYTVQPGSGQQGGQRGYGTVGSAPSQQFPGAQQGSQPFANQQYQQGGGSMQAQTGEEVPPTYTEAIKGNNKVQSQG